MASSLSGPMAGRGWTAFRAAPAGVEENRSKAAGLETDVVRTMILIALYAIPALAVMRPVTDNDLWMNLRAGRWIVEHGKVPVVDPFSGNGRGEPWLAYNWLFEVLIHGLHRRFGLAGIVAYRATMSCAMLVAIHRLVARRERRFAVATGQVGLAFLALIPLLSERTWLFTILFSTLTLDVILDLRTGKKSGMAWMLPPVCALGKRAHPVHLRALPPGAGVWIAADRPVHRSRRGDGNRAVSRGAGRGGGSWRSRWAAWRRPC